VPDELLAEVAVHADSWEDAAHAIGERYRGLVERVSIYTPPNAPDDAEIRAMVEILDGY
jgi:hypothetical protein